MTSPSSKLLVVGGITVASLLAYAVYFDYRRRNDADFRRKLRKEKKRVDKAVASQASLAAASSSALSKDALRDALAQVKQEDIPPSPEQKEAYFMQQVAIGEQLSAQGPDFYIPAAMSFFRALRVYPSPVELMMIYQKTVIEPIFKLVVELTNLDVSSSSQSSDPASIDEDETSPVRGSPPSETSSQEWDKLSNPDAAPP